MVAPPVTAKQWTPEFPREKASVGAVIIENEFTGGVSYLRAVRAEDSSSYNCVGMWEGPCNSRDLVMNGTLTLGVCATSAEENCVEAIAINHPELGMVRGELIGNVAGPTIKANSRFGIPAGATAGKWRVPGVLHKGGTDTYFVSVSYQITAREFGKAEFFKVVMHITPYTETAGSYSEVTFGESKDSSGKNYGYQAGPAEGCVWQEQDVCGVPEDFSDAVAPILTVRMSNDIGGWFSGRLTNPNISVTRHSAKSNRMVISGEPVQVQRLSVAATRESATSEFRKYFGSSSEDQYYFALTPATSPNAFSTIRAMRAQARDTATGVSSHWLLETAAATGHYCLKDTSKVNGIVTTNSTVYQGTAPSFSKGFLNYKVAGMHFESDGVTETQGSYDLVMRSEVARCLYGFSKAPVSATITVAGEGDKNISTTVLSEKNGWLKLAAYGFTFSEKTIKVKLTQKKQTTITCVAPGKKNVKVTSSSPKCPKGYKKK